MNLNTQFKLSVMAAASVLAAGSLVTYESDASSHREAPYISKLPQVDGTDFYMFNSYEPGREGYVTLLANYIPVQAAYGGPNYFELDDNAIYEIHIDNDGDAIEDITFQFDFTNQLSNNGAGVTFDIGSPGNQVTQSSVLKNAGVLSADDETGLSHTVSYTLSMISDDRRIGTSQSVTNSATGEDSFRKPFDYSGTKTFGGPGNYSNYANSFIYETDIPGCDAPGKVFVGQRHEGFKIALGEIFDLVNLVPIEGDSAPGAGDGGGFPGGVTQSPERNILQRNNVTTLALEVPASCLVGDGNGVIGAWSTSSLRQATLLNPRATFDRPEVSGGAFTQVSRMGNFLVNELVIGYPDKDRFNGSEPKDDGQFAQYVTNPVLPAVISSLFRDAVNDTLGTNLTDLAPSNFPRNDLVAGFLTGFAGVNQLDTVTPSEMLRVNTAIPATPRADQHPLGVAAGDLAGFPNGRRPGDDSVDIALRVVMGALCYDLPIGGTPTNLGLCDPSDAPIGNQALTDGAPINATEFNNSFPYLLTPYPGSPTDAPIPTPTN